MQLLLFQVLKERPTGTVNNAFGDSSGSGRIHNVQRMVKRQLGEFDDRGVRKFTTPIGIGPRSSNTGQIRGG